MTGPRQYQDTWAVTYTVKNEARLLPDALRYYLKLGASRIYVFWDGTTDDTKERVDYDPRIVSAESEPDLGQLSCPDWITDILPRWQANMDVRKRINTYKAAAAARAEGITWLISIDPDELLSPDPSSPSTPFFTASGTTDQILFPNVEAIGRAGLSRSPFNELVYTTRHLPATNFIWRSVRKLYAMMARPTPKRMAQFDDVFFATRFTGTSLRSVVDPRDGAFIPTAYNLGYTSYKSAIRTESFEHFLFNIHKWQKDKRAPTSKVAGQLVHFDLPDAAYFISKFRQRQKAMMVKDFFVRHKLAEIAIDLPVDQATAFYKSSIGIDRVDHLEQLCKRGLLKRDERIKRVFESMLAHEN